MLKINERVVGGVVIVDLGGSIRMEDGSEELIKIVQGLLNRGETRIILNMALVPYVDSCGLYALVRCHSALIKQSRGLRLLNPTKKVQDLLAITKLLTVFEAFLSEDEAVSSFG